MTLTVLLSSKPLVYKPEIFDFLKDICIRLCFFVFVQEAILALSGGNPVPPERCMSQASTLSNSYDICRLDSFLLRSYSACSL